MEKTKINYIQIVIYQPLSQHEQLAQLVKVSEIPITMDLTKVSWVRIPVMLKFFQKIFSKFSRKYAFKEG